MYQLLIKNYINNLTKNDLISFSLKNNICLNNFEIDYVYDIIKNRYEDLLSNNYMNVFNESKSFLSNDNYLKLLELYEKNYNKYKNLL